MPLSYKLPTTIAENTKLHLMMDIDDTTFINGKLNEDLVELLHKFKAAGHQIVFVTNRSEISVFEESAKEFMTADQTAEKMEELGNRSTTKFKTLLEQAGLGDLAQTIIFKYSPRLENMAGVMPTSEQIKQYEEIFIDEIRKDFSSPNWNGIGEGVKNKDELLSQVLDGKIKDQELTAQLKNLFIDHLSSSANWKDAIENINHEIAQKDSQYGQVGNKSFVKSVLQNFYKQVFEDLARHQHPDAFISYDEVHAQNGKSLKINGVEVCKDGEDSKMMVARMLRQKDPSSDIIMVDDNYNHVCRRFAANGEFYLMYDNKNRAECLSKLAEMLPEKFNQPDAKVRKTGSSQLLSNLDLGAQMS